VNNREELSEKSSPEKKEKASNRKQKLLNRFLNRTYMAVLRQGEPRSRGQFPQKALYTHAPLT